MRGYTLVELSIVAAVVIVLLGVGFTSLWDAQRRASRDSEMNTLYVDLVRFYAERKEKGQAYIIEDSGTGNLQLNLAKAGCIYDPTPAEGPWTWRYRGLYLRALMSDATSMICIDEKGRLGKPMVSMGAVLIATVEDPMTSFASVGIAPSGAMKPTWDPPRRQGIADTACNPSVDGRCMGTIP